MSIQYSDFISLAETLQGADNHSETALRSSASRAYYGFYHAALNYANAVGTPPPSATSGPTHAKLGAFYQEDLSSDMSRRLQMKQIGWSLKGLHELRCKADYRVDSEFDLIEAQSCLQRCRDKIQLVEGLMASCAA